MSDTDKQEFRKAVYEIVAEIPKGKVLSYGMIARLAGHPGYQRMVGRILNGVSQTLNLPCHRVVNSEGRLVPGWSEQKKMLTDEGVSFRKNGNVNMSKHGWNVWIEFERYLPERLKR